MAKGWYGIMSALLLLSACRTMDVYDMELLRPSYINHTVGADGVLLIDNAGKQPDFMGHTLIVPNQLGGDSVSSVTVKSAASKPLLLDFLRDRMVTEGFYPLVDVAPDHWLPGNKTGYLDFVQSDPLSDHQLNTLMDSSAHRLWISLDGWQLKSVTKVSSPIQGPYSTTFEATRDVYITVVWRLYDVWADSLLVAFKQNDTLYWLRRRATFEQVVNAMPTVDSTLTEIADYVVGRVLNVLTPYWESVSRWYYITGGFRMKLAHDAVRLDNWDKAAVYWEEESQKGVGRSAYRAAMNMMLYYERLGEPEAALEWSEKATTIMQQPFSKGSSQDKNLLGKWKVTLKRRVDELKRLLPSD